jgi:inner membrane protein
VEPVTHALVSLALARAGQRRLPRFGTAMMVTAGVAADLDYASYFGGAGAFLRLHRAALHSLPGAVVIACATAGAFCAFDRKSGGKSGVAGNAPLATLSFVAAAIVSAIGAVGHILLDLASGTGVQLFWPFHVRLYAWSIVQNLDPWILIALIGGLLLPQLFRLVSDEIGDRKKRARGHVAAIVTLALVAAYLGGRAMLHSDAVDLVLSREYRGQAPLAAGAFASSSSPFDWRGVVVTDNTIEEIDVGVEAGARFDPDRSLAHYKPDDSPALRAGQQADATQTFLKYARFPLAHVERLEDGYRFELHDLQFESGDLGPENIFVRVDLDSSLHVTRQGFLFASHPNP